MDKKIQLMFFVAIVIVVGGAVGAGLAYIHNVPAQTSPAPAPVVPAEPTTDSPSPEELAHADLIRLETPRPHQTVSSPLTIKGQARGFWFFEASFPVVLTDWDGKIIAQGIAQANPPAGGDWMTSEFVPFEATLTFTVDKNLYSDKGSLILRKDNPSGLPEHDDALEIPIVLIAK